MTILGFMAVRKPRNICGKDVKTMMNIHSVFTEFIVIVGL